jgi:linoleoyl-CoA desaturase
MNNIVSFEQKRDLEFKKTLYQRVSAYFAENKISKNYTPGMVVKSVVMLAAYILPFMAILFIPMPVWVVMLLYFFIGISMAGVGMSVMHDSNHAAYSSNQKVNLMMGFTMNMLGADAYNWKIKHNKLHHVFTNIYGKDEDIESRVILRFAYAAPLKKYHRYQHIYAWFLYSLMSLSMVFGDIYKRFDYRKKGITNISLKRFRWSISWLVVSKTLYFFTILVLPVLITSLLWWQVLAGFFIMHITTGIILSVVFQLAHVVDGPQQAMPDAGGKIHDIMLVHQLKETCDFSRNNKILSWYVGGLNFQVEHHLFPRICHVHYPAISKIVEKTTREFKMPYISFNSFFDALKSHYLTLKYLGRVQAIPIDTHGTNKSNRIHK